MTPEQKIQTKIIKFLKEKWYEPIKLIKTSKNWIPDLIVPLWDWKHIWIEVKTEVWKLSTLQKYIIKGLESIWDIVIVPYWYDDFIFKWQKLDKTSL